MPRAAPNWSNPDSRHDAADLGRLGSDHGLPPTFQEIGEGDNAEAKEEVRVHKSQKHDPQIDGRKANASRNLGEEAAGS
jgi:hypothetical protein